mgnify:FL=1
MNKAAYQPAQDILALGDAFYDVVEAARFPRHVLRFRNQRWAERVGLGDLTDAAWIDHFGRFQPLPGSLEQPLALRYHGHQFRVYNPEIGDGRGFLFAQLRDLADNRLLDLGTKGSGQTPYSRFGDGKLTLKGGVREVLATEQLEALGVETSKSFSLIETGEALTRHDEPSPTRSSVLVRLSHSHIRYGTFQRLAYFGLADEMIALTDYGLARYVPGAPGPEAPLEERVAALLDHAVRGAARLAASYMAAGFVHGVLNTDNINITAESFDYGPWRFAPTYDLAFTAAYFDEYGLYAFGRQAEALHWNVYQLAKALLTIVPKEAMVPVLETFPEHFENALVAAIFARLGLQPAGDEQANLALLQAMERFLIDTGMGLERFYFDWYGGILSEARREKSPAANTYAGEKAAPLRALLPRFQPDAAARENLNHPYFADDAPCTLLIDEVEEIWSAIDERDDWGPFNDKIARIRRMGEAYGRTSS